MIVSRAHGAGVLLVDFADEQVAIVDPPDAAPMGAQPDVRMREGFADKAAAATPLHFAVAPHPPHRALGRIGRCQITAIAPATALVERCGRTLAERFVGTVLIVKAQPARGAHLLCAPTRRWRPRRLGFEFAVPLFMRRVILGMTAPAHLHLDAQAHPPGAQLGEMHRPRTAEGRALIDVNGLGQTTAAEQPHELGLDGRQALIAKNPRAQPVAAVEISHRERIATLPVFGLKVALEIDRPDIVGPQRPAQRGPTAPRALRSPVTRSRQTQLLEQPTDRALRWQPRAWIGAPQPGPQLLGPKARETPACLDDPIDPERTQPAVLTARRARPSAQSFFAAVPVARPPFVAGLSADAEGPAELRKALLVGFHPLHELNLLFASQDIGRRHRRPQKCHPCDESKVSPM